MARFAIASPHVRKGIRILESRKFFLLASGIWEIFACGILNPGIRNLAQGIQNPVNDYNPNLSSTDNDLKSSIWNSGIHGVESRIQDCLASPYMG